MRNRAESTIIILIMFNMSGLDLFKSIFLNKIGDAVSGMYANIGSVVGRGFVYEESQFESKEF